MNKKQIIILVILGAIWGASFMFMRVLAPVFGPVLTASLRLLIGGVFLIIYFLAKKEEIALKRHLKIFITLGLISFAAPYFLFSLAALSIPSGLSAILNSTSPLFSFILGLVIFKERFYLTKILGLILGSIGVLIISLNAMSISSNDYLFGVICCLGAAFLYSVSGALIQKFAKDVDSKSLAVGNQIAGGLILLPLVIFYPVQGSISLDLVFYLIIFGVLGSGVASLIYFKLMKEVGPLKTLTVTYLLPIFGLFWGFTILGEEIDLSFISGLVLIIVSLLIINKTSIQNKF